MTSRRILHIAVVILGLVAVCAFGYRRWQSHAPPRSTFESAIVITSSSEEREEWRRVAELYPEAPVPSYEVALFEESGRLYRVFHVPTRRGQKKVYFDITGRDYAAKSTPKA